MSNQRPIDQMRNAGGAFQVGEEDDPSPIVAMFPIGGSFHTIKTAGIYRVQLADEIDPQRTNPDIPNVNQRVLDCGTDSELVRQTLMTAKRLCDPTFLGAEFLAARAIDLSFEALQDIVSMHQMQVDLAAELARLEESLAQRAVLNRSMVLPSINDITVRVETFLQKAQHATGDLFEIAKLFYPGRKFDAWFDGLLAFARSEYGEVAEFTKFLVTVVPVLKLMRNSRNCVEHPKPGHQIEVRNIAMAPDGGLHAPTIMIAHQETPQSEMAVSAFMEQAVQQIAGIFEVMLAFLAGYNMKPIGGMISSQVVLYPPDLQAAFNVRYGYGTYLGDQIAPIG